METITDLPQLDPKKQYTFVDYLTWRFSERVELIKGWLYKLSPAPRRVHQKIEGALFYQLYSFLQSRAARNERVTSFSFARAVLQLNFYLLRL